MNRKSKNLIMNNEINSLLKELILQIKTILSDKFIGMYIGGSLANHSFDDESSDIDCYIMTTTQLPKNITHQIEIMHKQFYSSELPYAKKIEASYIPKNDLLNFGPKKTRPYFNEGNFYLAHYGNNFLIELFMLREKGITVVGPDIKNLIKKISTDDLKIAIQKNLQEYWKKTLNDLSKFERSYYQVFAILTMCRTLYSLETGDITSKKEAANWAANHITQNWKSLIEQAHAWKPADEFNRLEETQQFVRYVIDKIHHG